jgi:hypothetical protein
MSLHGVILNQAQGKLCPSHVPNSNISLPGSGTESKSETLQKMRAHLYFKCVCNSLQLCKVVA